MKTALLLVVMVVALTATTFSQDNVDFGYWNDIQVSTPVNKQLDVIGGVRFNTKRNASVFAEQRIYGGFNWKSKNGRFTVQPWVIFLKNFAKKPFTEVRPQLTLGYKFTTKNKINITPRVRMEYHAKSNGLKNDGRIVPIIAIDKKISKNYSLFNTNELFWIPIGNSKDTAKYRQRYFFGVNRVINKKLSVDLFYLYQRDEQIAPKHNHALGLTWKVRL